MSIARTSDSGSSTPPTVPPSNVEEHELMRRRIRDMGLEIEKLNERNRGVIRMALKEHARMTAIKSFITGNMEQDEIPKHGDDGWSEELMHVIKVVVTTFQMMNAEKDRADRLKRDLEIYQANNSPLKRTDKDLIHDLEQVTKHQSAQINTLREDVENRDVKIKALQLKIDDARIDLCKAADIVTGMSKKLDELRAENKRLNEMRIESERIRGN